MDKYGSKRMIIFLLALAIAFGVIYKTSSDIKKSNEELRPVRYLSKIGLNLDIKDIESSRVIYDDISWPGEGSIIVKYSLKENIDIDKELKNSEKELEKIKKDEDYEEKLKHYNYIEKIDRIKFLDKYKGYKNSYTVNEELAKTLEKEGLLKEENNYLLKDYKEDDRSTMFLSYDKEGKNLLLFISFM